MSQSSGTVAWTRHIGHVMIQKVWVDIGGQTIDTHYGDFLTIWNELTETASQQANYDDLIGNVSTLTTPASSIPATRIYVPLRFWFNENPGLYLPLVALQFNPVKINFQLRPANQCYITNDGNAPTSGVPSLVGATLNADYIYLDNTERDSVAQNRHEYLITQLQFNGEESVSGTNYQSRLTFNHPCKEIFWVIQYDSNVLNGANRWSDYTDSATNPSNFYAGADPMASSNLKLNGQDRYTTQQFKYFNGLQPYWHHTKGPATGIYNYAFAQWPEEIQPSGSLNFSRIDNANLVLNMTQAVAQKLRVYATNTNVFKVAGGSGAIEWNS
jgi:hypothetical protein